MAHLAYLEPDDELTTAASRIRLTPGDRVGLVLPFNSRVATSRINFRLLAREVNEAGRILDVIAPDAAARALAISAGLRAFATVAEYEAAVGQAGMQAAPRWTEDLAPGLSSLTNVHETVEQWGPEPWLPLERDTDARSREVADARRRPPTVVRRAKPMGSPVVLVVILVLAVLLGLGGAAGVMLLPAAEITVTAKAEDVPALALAVVADPSVKEPDATGLRIPAQLVELPVQVSGDYKATGKKVTETKATGSVTFTTINTLSAQSVPKGTRLSTVDGTFFATTATVVVPMATVHFPTISLGSVSVGVVAVKAGIGGNVAGGAITQVPSSLSAVKIKASNPAATSGGTHTETVQIAQADVDAALKDLNARLQTAFETAVAAPSGLPAGAVSYPDTAVLGGVTPDTDPATLAGTQVETFSLALAAAGSILAVDASPIAAIGEAAIARAVQAGYRLVPGSVVVKVGTGVPADGGVTFEVQASAKRIRILDAAALRTQVLGQTEAAARAALSAYGSVEISFWPGWVSAVPSNADRVTVTVGDGAPGAKPGSSLSPVPSSP